MYLFSGLEIFDASDRRPSDEDSSRRYVGAGGGAGLQRESGRSTEEVAPLQRKVAPLQRKAFRGQMHWLVISKR